MIEDQRQKLCGLLDDLSTRIDVIESFGWSLEGKDFETFKESLNKVHATINPIITTKEVILQPQEFDIEVAGKKGIRVRGTSSHDCVIEFKDGNAWKPLKYVQGIYIELDVNDPFPNVRVRYIVVP